MRHHRSRQRSAVRTLWALAQVVGHVLAPWKRPMRLRWGARSGEPDPSLPGEDLVPDDGWGYTHAVSVTAPASDVWPWVAQMGQGRGGFYSFERLENLFGCRITNTDAVHSELQNPEVGDEIRLHPTSPPLHVAAVEPGRSLVLRGAVVEDPPAETDNIWAFHIVDDGPCRCRLIERGKTVHGDSVAERLFFSTLLVEPIGFVMGREMLLGIKERAETMEGSGAAPSGAGSQVDGVTGPGH